MTRLLPIAAVLIVAAGCSGVDKMNRKMDMASERLASVKPVYEGRISSAKRVGALYSLQFEGGQTYEAYLAPPALVPGDVVRVYKTDKGYEAHLWRESKDVTLPPPPTPVPTPMPRLGQ